MASQPMNNARPPTVQIRGQPGHTGKLKIIPQETFTELGRFSLITSSGCIRNTLYDDAIMHPSNKKEISYICYETMQRLNQGVNAEKATTELCPPNPNEFEIPDLINRRWITRDVSLE
ncbi:hypothetical protein Leryth_009743 [Lithospermum erythrorhizon]|nr:hypothetical protein Leryth_009743 [Lithospermum erythrorhizon]